jgi:hypothetical protein
VKSSTQRRKEVTNTGEDVNQPKRERKLGHTCQKPPKKCQKERETLKEHVKDVLKALKKVRITFYSQKTRNNMFRREQESRKSRYQPKEGRIAKSAVKEMSKASKRVRNTLGSQRTP